MSFFYWQCRLKFLKKPEKMFPKYKYIYSLISKIPIAKNSLRPSLMAQSNVYPIFVNIYR